jgi:hypothetical protein
VPDTLTTWWWLLCATAAINIIAWSVSNRIVLRRAAGSSAAGYVLQQRLSWLALVYVLGCAFRSAFPMLDVPRSCLHDTWISRIAVGRSVATVAELCFAAQWWLVLRAIAELTADPLARFASRALLPLIVVAELWSWGAVLLTNHLLHAVENSLWTIAAAMAVCAFVAARSRVTKAGKRFLTIGCLFGCLYIAFMVTNDVPMWISHWRADIAAGQASSTLAEGMRTALARCMVVHDWERWRHHVPWLSLYFSVAVWISIALAHAPALERAQAPRAYRADHEST